MPQRAHFRRDLKMSRKLVAAGTVLLLLSAALVVIFLQLSAAPRYSRTVSYDDEVVIKCAMTDKWRMQELLNEDYIDPWGLDKDGKLDVRMTTHLWSQLQDKFPECEVVIDDVEVFVRDMEDDMLRKRESKEELKWFEDYRTFEEILKWYEDLAADNPETVQYVKSIGQSYEGRNMPAVHITRVKNDSDFEVKRIYFQCLIHAREWITGAVCMYIADYLCANYGTDANVTSLLDEVEFIFIPVVNPDGYVHTWTNNRLWRKGRSLTPVPGCIGIDLNRNYDLHWGEGGSSSNPCSTTYRGSAPASAAEVVNTVNYFKANAPIIGAIDWHSYGQLILRPWGWTADPAPDEEQLAKLGDEMKELIFDVHGMEYISGMWSQALYFGTGVASDWFYGDEASSDNMGYRAAGFTVELRDMGHYGFRLPPDQIIPNAEEVLPAALHFAESLLENPLIYE